ncbi:MAG: halocyanin domain-containing protein [Halobacteriaceae archaeon]
MAPDGRQTRRQVLTAAAAGLGGGTLAGCGAVGGGDGGGDGDPGPPPGARTFDGWFADVTNYEGVVDETGSDRVTVSVGTQANGGANGFGPPAVRVDPGTTVVWEWTGDGLHNVVATDDAFASPMYASAGRTYEHAFDAAGTTRYVCEPHRHRGMKGVVVVA